MPKPNSETKQRYLTPFSQDIWLCTGPIVKAALDFKYPTRTIVIRLKNNELFIWSPIPVSERLSMELANIGEVAHIISPNNFHHIHLTKWQLKYPKAKFYAPKRLIAKRPDLRFDFELNKNKVDYWNGVIDYQIVGGNIFIEEVIFFHGISKTLIVTDLLQQLPRDLNLNWRKTVASLDGLIGETPQLPLKFRLTFFGKKIARADISTVSNWSYENLIIAHGTPIQKNARLVFDKAFEFLYK